MATWQSTTRNLLIILLIVLAIGVVYVVAMPDQRSGAQKVGDAIHELPQGADKAANELGNDRTPGEKLGDAMRNAGDKVKENSESR